MLRNLVDFASALMSRNRKPSVLLCCMGNICRSPTAHAVLMHKLREAGIAQLVQVDSAGTHGYHVGSPPDARACSHAARRGYDLSSLRARRVAAADFERHDLILAMDEENLEALRDRCPSEHRGKVRLLLDYAPAGLLREVPDPYYGGPEGFEQVLDLVEQACEGLVRELVARVREPA